MAIHKLANGPLVITVTKAEQQEGQFGSQVVFDGDNDVRVYVSELTAMKQLARLNLTLESVIGKTIHLEQIKKDGKTFTNITLAREGATATPAAPAQGQPQARPAAAPAMSFDEVVALYANCVNAALVHFAARIEEAGIAPDAAAVQSAAATLFIRASK